MSYLFGAIRQIAFVVHDLDQALHHWTHTLGVGPFTGLLADDMKRVVEEQPQPETGEWQRG